MTDLLEMSASELRPGDRVTFGDHTGWYRVRRVRFLRYLSGSGEGTVRLDAWPRRWAGNIELHPLRVAAADETVWVKR